MTRHFNRSDFTDRRERAPMSTPVDRERQLRTYEYERPQTRTLTSQSLFLGEHEICIEHHGALYRLKITRQGKLILNK
jgi:hemin uptake protein HemP